MLLTCVILKSAGLSTELQPAAHDLVKVAEIPLARRNAKPPLVWRNGRSVLPSPFGAALEHAFPFVVAA